MSLSKVYRKYKRFSYLLSKLMTDKGKKIVVYNKFHPIYTSICEQVTFEDYKFVYIDFSVPLNILEKKLYAQSAIMHCDAACLEIDKFNGKPLVVECEGLPSEQILSDKRILDVFVESKAAVAPLKGAHPELKLLYPSVHYRGVPATRQFGSQQTVTLLAVGYGGMVKGFDVLYKIYEAIKERFPVKLIIAGTFGHNYTHYPEITKEAYERADFPSIQKKIAGDPNVTFGPVRGERLIAEMYPAADIYLHLSRMETFGYSILEAMSFGLPVVATGVRAIPEMVHDGVNGFLVNDFTHDFNTTEWFNESFEKGLAAVTKLIEQPELRKKMGHQSAELVKTTFSLDNKRKILEAVYDRILNK